MFRHGIMVTLPPVFRKVKCGRRTRAKNNLAPIKSSSPRGGKRAIQPLHTNFSQSKKTPATFVASVLSTVMPSL
jgi:hypothetical protein